MGGRLNLQDNKTQWYYEGMIIREWGDGAEQRAQEETHAHMEKIYDSWHFKSAGERNYF